MVVVVVVDCEVGWCDGDVRERIGKRKKVPANEADLGVGGFVPRRW